MERTLARWVTHPWAVMEPPWGVVGGGVAGGTATAAINRRRWSDNNLGDLTDAGPRFIAGHLETENSFLLSQRKKK